MLRGSWASTVEELDAVLDKATDESREDGYPYLVQIYLADDPHGGPLLKLGVGHTFSFLWYDKTYVAGDLDGGHVTSWDWSGPNDQPAGTGIPNELAREAAREFVRTGGQQPANVEWVEGD
jgi:Immunity protein Imm1